ncbi:MAG: cytochrome c3 family protein [Candidatus Binatia bacterium]
MGVPVNKWVQRTAVTLAVFVPAGAAVLFLGMQVSSEPRFCGSCHYMTPYYESWRGSTHHDVACVECHIPPGIKSELRKKYEALAMVARYFTGTYSTNPWAEVDDRSCLRSGCHTKRVLLGKEVYRGILFDHQPHLTEMRRGKRLRCTSCHSQIVQGSHISVTATTCFLCHFKDVPLNTGTAGCTLCHAIPEQTITTAGLAFDHGEVKRFDMNCTLCHEGVVKGNGAVPRERCYTCHNDPKRLSLYGQTALLHRMHVTRHKVECLNCHIEIVHKIPAREAVLATTCRRCHSSAAGHSAVRDFYRGIGGQGVKPRPAVMYLAGVRCEACHTARHAGAARASDVSCMSCHGPKYLTIYRTWQVGLAKRLAGVSSEIQEIRKQWKGQRDATQEEALREAEANVALVEAGKGIHNPAYALDLLERSHEQLSAIRGTTKDGTGRMTPPWLEAPYAADCLRCHFGIEYLSRPALGHEFPHGTHVVSARLRCTICHDGMEHHGGFKINAARCERCHAQVRGPMVNVAAKECLTCHTADIGTVSDAVAFPHRKHIAAGLGCELCHTGVMKKPHLEFARSTGALPKLGHAFCGTCHAGDVPSAEEVPPEGADCTKCHVAF